MIKVYNYTFIDLWQSICQIFVFYLCSFENENVYKRQLTVTDAIRQQKTSSDKLISWPILHIFRLNYSNIKKTIVCLALTVTPYDVFGKLTSDTEVLIDQKLSGNIIF
jgi:hypothetical protein